MENINLIFESHVQKWTNKRLLVLFTGMLNAVMQGYNAI